MKSLYKRSSTSTSHYTTAIGAGSIELETFPGIPADGTATIRSLAISSKENRAWGIEVYDNTGLLMFKHNFEETDGNQHGGYYNYFIGNLEWYLPHTTAHAESASLFNKKGSGGAITVGLRNNSGTAKTAGTSGAVIVTFIVEQ